MMGLTFLLLSLLSSLFGAEAFVPSTSFSSRGITELKMSAPEIEVVSNPSKEFLDEKGGKCRCYLCCYMYVASCHCVQFILFLTIQPLIRRQFIVDERISISMGYMGVRGEQIPLVLRKQRELLHLEGKGHSDSH